MWELDLGGGIGRDCSVAWYRALVSLLLSAGQAMTTVPSTTRFRSQQCNGATFDPETILSLGSGWPSKKVGRGRKVKTPSAASLVLLPGIPKKQKKSSQPLRFCIADERERPRPESNGQP